MMQTYIFVDDGGNVVGEYSTNDVGNARAECARRTDAEKKNLAVYRWVSKYIYVAPDTKNKECHPRTNSLFARIVAWN